MDWFKKILAWFQKKPAQPEKPQPPIENVSPVKPAGDLAHMTLAKSQVGIKEVSGDKDNPKIIEYHATTTYKGKHDEVPWCSSFVNWCFFKLGWKRTNSAGASSWLKWGIRIKKPRYGCVVVKTREGGNHVTFWVRPEIRKGVRGYIGLGGNQGNQVCEAWYPDSSVRGYMWPEELADLLKPEEKA